jgi:hypothetical protein
MDCVICFSEAEESVSCSNPECDVIICHECLRAMIDFCWRNFHTIPACPARKCDGEYIYSKISTALTEDTGRQYDEICRKRVMDKPQITDKEEMMRKRKAKRDMIRQLREDNKKLITHFQPALVNVIRISGLEKRLAIVSKTNAEKIAQVLEKANSVKIPCGALTCRGIKIERSEAYHECNACFILTCVKCAAIVSGVGDNHVCKQSEIDSVLAVNSITKCPTCNIPATKGEGCKLVTCPVCNTNFHCESGEVTKQGGHNLQRLKLVQYDSLTDMSDHPTIKDALARIEAVRPSALKPPTAAKMHGAKCYEQLVKTAQYTRVVNQLQYHREMGTLTIDNIKRAARYIIIYS